MLTIKNEKISSKKTVVIFFLLYFFAAFRGNGDGDYFNYLFYVPLVNNIKTLFNFNFPLEFGFRILSYIINSIDIHTQFIFVIMNLIPVLIIYKLTKISSFPPLSILFYLYFYIQFDMHATRTGVALSLSLLSIYFLYNRLISKSIASFILAVIFHKSAFILLLIPITDYVIKNKSVKWTLTLFSVSILFVAIVNVPSLIVNILDFLRFNNLSSRISFYLESEVFGYPMSLLDPRIIFYLLVTLMSIFVDFQKAKNKISRGTMILLINLSIIILCRSSTSLAMRLSSYFSYMLILIGPNIYMSWNELIKNSSNIKLLSYNTGFIFKIFGIGMISIITLFTIILQFKYVVYLFFS